MATVIDEYIEGFSGRQRELMLELVTLIRELAPEASERMSYRMPTFWLNGNLVHFAAFDQHVGFYPGAEGVALVEGELAGLKHAKGSIQFPLDRPLPRDLVTRIVRFRVEQQSAR